jgi:hypothetical protein
MDSAKSLASTQPTKISFFGMLSNHRKFTSIWIILKMNSSTRSRLERIVRALDNVAEPLGLDGCGECEQIATADEFDEEKADEHIVVHQLLQSANSGVLSACQTALIGENILTRSLTTRGWMFWSESPLVGAERSAVESASLKCSERMSEDFRALGQELADRVDGDKAKVMIIAGKADQLVRSLINDLSTDLKHVINGR